MTKHISSVALNYANNLTLYESTGCGTLLISDRRKNLSDLFIEDKEIVTYSTGTELSEKINFYLKNDTLRQKIALAGQKKTLTEHSYQVRMKQFIHIISTQK